MTVSFNLPLPVLVLFIFIIICICRCFTQPNCLFLELSEYRNQTIFQNKPKFQSIIHLGIVYIYSLDRLQTNTANNNDNDNDNSNDIVVRTADDKNNIYFYNSTGNQFKNNILIEDPNMCCKNFGLYKVVNENEIKNMIGASSKENRIKNLTKIYDKSTLTKYFTGDPITSNGQGKGLCLYIGDNNRNNRLDQFDLPDQSTWNSGSVTPSPAKCDATPGPCVINLVHQFGGRWWDYFQNNPSPNQAFNSLS